MGKKKKTTGADPEELDDGTKRERESKEEEEWVYLGFGEEGAEAPESAAAGGRAADALVLVLGLDLHDADARADVDQQVREHARIDAGEAVLGLGVALVDEHLVGDVAQQEVAALDQARHLLLLVHTAAAADPRNLTQKKSHCSSTEFNSIERLPIHTFSQLHACCRLFLM